MSKKNSGSVTQAIKALFIGTFVFGIAIILLMGLGSWVKKIEAEIQTEEKTSAQVVQNPIMSELDKIRNRDTHEVSEKRSFILEPGQRPVRIETNGSRLDWEQYPAGYNGGSSILLIRFIFANGQTSQWQNISNQWISEKRLPDRRSIKAVEFGVPPEGQTEGLEVTITKI